jgi:hypothetical protein
VKKLTGSIRGVCVLAAVAAVLALAPAAFAQSSGNTYGGTAGATAAQVAGGGSPDASDTAGAVSSGGTGGATATEAGNPDDGSLLAFTGLDVALIVGGGLLLLASGVALSRVVARHPA